MEIFPPSLGVFLCLLGIYYFTYSGFPVSDDEQLFAAVSQNIAIGRGNAAPQMYGNNRLLGQYTGSGPLHVYLGAAFLNLLPGQLGSVQALYLLTPLYTALSAALIVMILFQMDFSTKTAVVGGMIFGISTIAWPYSQTNFREPLAMLLMTISLFFLKIAIHSGYQTKATTLFWFVSLVAFVGALFTKIILLAVLPAFVYLLLIQARRGTWKIILISGGVLLALAAAISIIAPQTRFSLEFFDRLWDLRRGFPYRQIPRALLEILFVPGRGSLVYNPILLLLPLAWFQSKGPSRQVWTFGILALAGLSLAQATAYGAEWWGITWSTRFLLPVLPFLVIALAPAVDFLLNSPKKRFRYVFWCITGAGVFIQLGGVLVANSTYMLDLFYVQLVPDVGRVLWSVAHAPLVAHWRLLLSGAELNLAAVRIMDRSPGWAAAVFSGCVLLFGFGAILLVRVLKGNFPEKLRWQAAGALIFGCLIMPVLILVGFREDPRYGANRSDIVQMSAVVEREVEPNDVILVFPYLRTSWNYFLNFYQGQADWYSLPNTFPAGDLSSTMQLIESFGSQYSRVWLVLETGTWEAVPVFIESYLSQLGDAEAVAVFETAEENLEIRLLLFSFD